MIRTVFSHSIFLILFSLFVAFPVTSQAEEFLAGSIVSSDGSATRITKINTKAGLKATYKGKSISIRFRDIKKIERLGDGKIFRITNNADKVFQVEKVKFSSNTCWDCRKGHEYIYFSYLDEISMSEKSHQIHQNSMVVLSLEGDAGRLKLNERTRELFPPEYLYDPISKEELVWHTPNY